MLKDLKHALLRERSETLVVIPCWWDGSEKRYNYNLCINFCCMFILLKNKILIIVFSLGGTVLFYRTDLLPMIEQADSLGDPIPINPPSNFFFGMPWLFVLYPSLFVPISIVPALICLFSGGLPGVGLLMLASFPASVEFKVSISASKTWYGSLSL